MRIYNLIHLFLLVVFSACGSYRSAEKTILTTENSLDSLVQKDSCISLSYDHSTFTNLKDVSIEITELSYKDSILYPSRYIHISEQSSTEQEKTSSDTVVDVSSTHKSSISTSNNKEIEKPPEKENYLLSLREPIYIIIFSFCIFFFMKKYNRPLL